MGTFRRRRLDEEGLEAAPRFNYTSDLFEPLAAAEQYRTALAAVDNNGIIDRRTFPEVAADANRWAALLRAQGLAAGDRIIVRLPPGSAWCGVILGALKAGIVAVSCSPSLPFADVARRAGETQARLLVADEPQEESELEWLPVIRAAVAMAQLGRLTGVQPTQETTVDDLALIVYTAGTTSVPVGAAHTHGNVEAVKEHGAVWLDTRPGDVVWCSVDTGRPSAIWDLLGAWSTGATIVLHADAGRLEIEEWLELIDKLGVTALSDTPRVYEAMVEEAARQQVSLPRLRRAVSTGGSLSPELIASFRDAFGLTIQNAYLQAESLVLTANLGIDDSKDGSIGRPLYGAELAVITDDGAVSGPGAEGDLAIIGDAPSLFTGYWNNPDAMEASVRGYWFLTGDRAMIDEDGYFWLAGRTLGSRDERKTLLGAEVGAEAAAAEARARVIAEAEEREEERRWEEIHAQAEARAREEEEARREAEERARTLAEEDARREAEERDREEARARAEAEERASREAAARAAAAAEEKGRREAEEREPAGAAARAAAVLEKADVQARKSAEAQARAEAKARQEAEAQAGRKGSNGFEPDPEPAAQEEEPSLQLYERLRAYGRSEDKPPT